LLLVKKRTAAKGSTQPSKQHGFIHEMPRRVLPGKRNEGNSKRADIVPPALLKSSVTVL
jgi:hypothetical protein